ncbi:MAG: pantothenate kinase [Pusillimonas sp.]|nr:pantothenate kinase [Pusillimonas sp.]
MIILIDAGNTRVKAGWISLKTGEREMTAVAFQHTHLDELSHWLDTLPNKPASALGVNVAGPTVGEAIEKLLEKHDCTINWTSGEPQTLNVANAYAAPEQLGPDRWLALLGLAQRPHPQHTHPDTPPCPLILANFGTATTIDTLVVKKPPNETNENLPQYLFPGGLILPGPDLMRNALAQNTANLPDANSSTTIYPTYTHQSIATGIAAAQAGAVVRQWLAGLEYYGFAPHVFAAGGGWPLVKEEVIRLLHFTQGRLDLPTTLIEWLPAPALDGLAALALQSKQSQILN